MLVSGASQRLLDGAGSGWVERGVRMAFRGLAMSGLLAGAVLLAGPATAQDSHCAGLPAAAQVEARSADYVIMAQLTSRGFACPRGFTIETVGPGTRCRQPGAIRIEDREPRRDCYAALGLGPVRSVPTLMKPTMSCPGTPGISTIVAIRGRNVGWQDVTLTAPPSAGVTIAHLRLSGGRTPAAEDPIRQDCFPHDCRLVRLTTRAGTPSRVELTLGTPNNAASTSFTLNTEATCPGR